MRCYICDEPLPYDHPLDTRTGKVLPCLVCLEVVEELKPPTIISNRAAAHDPYGWDVVTRQESDDLVGTVPAVQKRAEE